MRFLAPDVARAARDHAIRDYPNESCGAITAGGYMPLENRSKRPREFFRCDDQIEPLLQAGELLALIHSHPDGPVAPSEFDIQQQIVMDVPWGIVACDAEAALPPYFWGDVLEPPPLLGRDFRYGPSGTDGRGDCAALVRDWYRLTRQIMLPEFPRADRCWIGKPDLYRDNLLAAGFTRIGGRSDDPRDGDVVLMQIRHNEPNHIAIFAGRGMILHHLENRLSRHEPLVRWLGHVTDWFRYE